MNVLQPGKGAMDVAVLTVRMSLEMKRLLRMQKMQLKLGTRLLLH